MALSGAGSAAADEEFEPPSEIQNTGLTPGCLVVTWRHSSSGVFKFTVQVDDRPPIPVDPERFDKEICSLEPGTTYHVEVCALFATENEDRACTQASLRTVDRGVGEMQPSGPLPIPTIDQPIPPSIKNFGVGWRGTYVYDYFIVNYRPEGGPVDHRKHDEDGSWGWQPFDWLTPGTKYYFSVRGCNSGIFGDPCSGWSPEASVVIEPLYGPDTCKDGFVWRDAVPGDHICVTPERRQKVADDFHTAKSRAAAQSPAAHLGDPRCIANRTLPGCSSMAAPSCLEGFVPRAVPGEDVLVCVTPQERDLIAQENANPKQNRVLQ
ncbi:hypothetical protein CQY20_12230 [Mycolicibacterium agri]|uniref:Fibronectin type-III domain-containing protein n=1 Tax=Mycolicibacterium agri TaxID=36811 RepID=A0A2A7N3T7_MYCAG|nr:hypothetical protein CQY20_12230 [Mycolicibacterium agri]